MSLKIGFIGLGLIGGSLAKAIRRFHPSYEILAFDIQKDTLTLALSEGIIDQATSGIGKEYSTCDIIFLCTPVAYNTSYLHTLAPFLSPTTLLTDVGSVKSGIHRAVEKLGLEKQFIGGHPMTGSEKTGFSSSADYLLENSYYILTPSKGISSYFLMRYQSLVKSLGALPLILDYEEHDYITAAISHLPHLIASSLVQLIQENDTRERTMKMIAAGGFKDITRIASSSPTMWQQICLSNSKYILDVLDSYISLLSTLREHLTIKDASALYDFFEDAKEYRNSIGNASTGPLKKIYAIYCDILDETGGIATIATILANNKISLKNIGIVHNREFEEGVLRMEFYQEEPSHSATILLRQYGYTVYERT